MALGKEKTPSDAGAVGGFIAEGRPSAKKWFFFNLFAEGRPSANKSFYFFLNLCRGPPLWPSAKKFSGFFKNSLPRAGPRQRNGFFEIFNPLPRAYSLALGKEIGRIFSKKIFAEGYCLGPRQRTLLCRGPWSLPSAKRQKFKFFFVFCIPSTQAFHIYTYIYHT